MRSDERDIARIQVQITVAKWHLHSALSSVAGVAAHKLECARLAHAEPARSFPEATLTQREYGAIRRELSALQSPLGEGAEPSAQERAGAAAEDPPSERQ
jgi:hypothetical protein